MTRVAPVASLLATGAAQPREVESTIASDQPPVALRPRSRNGNRVYSPNRTVSEIRVANGNPVGLSVRRIEPQEVSNGNSIQSLLGLDSLPNRL